MKGNNKATRLVAKQEGLPYNVSLVVLLAGKDGCMSKPLKLIANPR
jgi:hypothetical protein